MMVLPSVHPQVTAAPTWRRTLAMAADAVPLATVWLLLAGAISAASSTPEPSVPWNLLDTVVDYIHARPRVVLLAGIGAGLLLFIGPWIAHLVMGRTPGKRLLGLEVVDRYGRPLSTARAAAHCALRVLSVALVFAGYLWALADPQRRTLHDRLAGVYVIQPKSARGGVSAPHRRPDAQGDAD